MDARVRCVFFFFFFSIFFSVLASEVWFVSLHCGGKALFFPCSRSKSHWDATKEVEKFSPGFSCNIFTAVNLHRRCLYFPFSSAFQNIWFEIVFFFFFVLLNKTFLSLLP